MILLLKLWLSKQFKASEVKSFADKQNCIFYHRQGQKVLAWVQCGLTQVLRPLPAEPLSGAVTIVGAKAGKAGALKTVMC